MDDNNLWDDDELDEDLPAWANHSTEAWRQRLADPRSTDELIELALSNDTDGYLEALQILQGRGTREVLDAARGLCASPIMEERKLGVNILGRLGDTAPMLRVARRLRMSARWPTACRRRRISPPSQKKRWRRCFPCWRPRRTSTRCGT